MGCDVGAVFTKVAVDVSPLWRQKSDRIYRITAECHCQECSTPYWRQRAYRLFPLARFSVAVGVLNSLLETKSIHTRDTALLTCTRSSAQLLIGDKERTAIPAADRRRENGVLNSLLETKSVQSRLS